LDSWLFFEHYHNDFDKQKQKEEKSKKSSNIFDIEEYLNEDTEPKKKNLSLIEVSLVDFFRFFETKKVLILSWRKNKKKLLFTIPLVQVPFFSNSEEMIASPAPGSYTLYNTKMSLGFQIQVGKQYCGEQFVVKSYDGACTVVNLGKVRWWICHGVSNVWL
jgi:hypothetical protein